MLHPADLEKLLMGEDTKDIKWYNGFPCDTSWVCNHYPYSDVEEWVGLVDRKHPHFPIMASSHWLLHQQTAIKIVQVAEPVDSMHRISIVLLMDRNPQAVAWFWRIWGNTLSFMGKAVQSLYVTLWLLDLARPVDECSDGIVYRWSCKDWKKHERYAGRHPGVSTWVSYKQALHWIWKVRIVRGEI